MPSQSSVAQHPGIQFKQRLAQGDTLYGAWCAIDSVATVEAMTTIGVDWILIDCEHGLASLDQCLPLIQAADRNQTCVFVRIPQLDASLIARLLDHGVHGLMLPKVSSVEAAQHLVTASHYPPQGTRGIGPHRATHYYSNMAEYFARANQQTVLAVQIEEREAVDNLEAILAVDGIDIAFVGPADLSASLGHFGEPHHADVERTVAHILRTVTVANVAAGYYCGSGKEAKQRAAQGFQMVNVGHDLSALVFAMRRQVEAART